MGYIEQIKDLSFTSDFVSEKHLNDLCEFLYTKLLDVSQTNINSNQFEQLVIALNKCEARIRTLNLSKNILLDQDVIQLQKLKYIDQVKDLSLSIDAMSPKMVNQLCKFLYNYLKNNK